VTKKVSQSTSGISQGYRDAIPLEVNLKINGVDVMKSVIDTSRQASLNNRGHRVNVKLSSAVALGRGN
jgi:hypothetical protein